MNKTINVMLEIRPAILCWRNIIDNQSRDPKASNCAKECQLSRAEPREVKDNSYNIRKYFCVKNICRHVIDNQRRDLQGSNCAKECQLNRAELREVKDNS